MSIVTSVPQQQTRTIGQPLIFAMAAASGIAVANIYYNQPMMVTIAASFTGQSGPGLIPTVTQLGYAAGLLLLVPLGDVFERRTLIVLQFLMLAVASLLAAFAPTGWTLLGASLLLGIGATAAQQIVPVAASLAAPARRGAVVGSVMSGLLGGILLSRTLAGLVAGYAGWRAMFLLGAPLALLGALLMYLVLPKGAAATRSPLGYPALMASLIHLWREEPRLRQATLTQAALFASFSAFWTILALYLDRSVYHLGSGIAGLFGVVGAVGVFAAPAAGRLADRVGGRPVIILGAALTLAAWLLFIGWTSLIGLTVGVILLDLGVQSALVANQQVIFGLREEAKGRVNTLFMGGMFLGGTLGSMGAMMAWDRAGWQGVGYFAMVLAILAGVFMAIKPRQAW
ncbi:MFS transporter [Acerihabitans arboris]|uniref:MFS transporter n=1 Tax=Acerihabitans arboris TaxID=2691583 RepID=A0A845SU78_9GAMM|nr:MFS transporter [Acerihabitans arboris]NDL64575.1 MFS transporter [Acerihabitans arboris]